jgi:hypothetical protein
VSKRKSIIRTNDASLTDFLPKKKIKNFTGLSFIVCIDLTHNILRRVSIGDFRRKKPDGRMKCQLEFKIASDWHFLLKPPLYSSSKTLQKFSTDALVAIEINDPINPDMSKKEEKFSLLMIW